MQSLWEDFLIIAREEVGSRVVETWFKAVTIMQWDNAEQIVYLSAPNAFVCSWLEKNYRLLFQVHLGRLLNVAEPKVVFVNASVSLASQNMKVLVPDVSKTAMISVETFKAARAVSQTTKKGIFRVNRQPHERGRLNDQYQFGSFVVGPSNSLAFAAASAVAKKPGELYNPLFIYGGSGLGKTHLLHAIGNLIQENDKNASVLYQTADSFVREFIHAIRFDKIDQFQKKYQKVDVLLVDDIQFISNKETTQEAFFHIFNSLYDARKQLVFSSDTFPQNINGIAERLRSRLACGMVTDIHQPQIETKIAILKRKAEQRGQILDDDVTQFIASHVVSNVRELEGTLIRVIAYAHLTKQSITVDLARKVIFYGKYDKKRPIDFKRVIKVIQKHFLFSLEDLRSKNRNKELARARQATMYVMKKSTDKSLREIGAYLGGRNHATVKHALDTIELQMSKNSKLQQQIRIVEQEL